MADEVGEGGIFTKQALRSALPQFEQVDRRMRDLRSHGWRIDTNREDAQLSSSELRLVYVGPRPGDPSFKSKPNIRVTSKERIEAISAADFRCSQCGVQLGERDESEAGFAQLRVIRTGAGLIVACGLCANGAPGQAQADFDLLRAYLSRLSTDELSEFRARVRAGDMLTPLESAMALAARVPREIAVKHADEALDELLGQDPTSAEARARR
ncbi:hypothetical protein [Microbacterium sp. SSM24]|uniref:hypothetical protein n=1 Tax=Microbacterium sp. SSM24 TaxID=2991714 RepID=UPI002225FFFE|nr:hypothetical protein [Microbacterium sp. SSM24]MCW3493895.1 hypothetical protein [Microbacterium sp. SSM24]